MRNIPQVSASRRHLPGRSTADILTMAMITTVLFPVFIGLGVKVAIALPLSTLLGLTGQRFLALMFHGEHLDLFAPSTLVALYFTVNFGLRTLFISFSSAVHWLGLTPYEDYLPQALWCTCTGYIAFLIGYHSSLADWFLVAVPRGNPYWPKTVPALRIAMVMAVGFASMVYLVSIGVAVGGYDSLEFVSKPPPGLPILLERTVNVGWIAVCVCFFLRLPMLGRRSIWLLVSLSIVLLGLKLALTGSKQAVFEPLAEALICYHYLRRRLRLWQMLIVGVPTLVIAFGLVNFYRFVTVGGEGAVPKNFHDLGSRVSSASDSMAGGAVSNQPSAFEQMMNRQAGVDGLAVVMKYTGDPVPFGLGKTFITVPLLSLIPRFVWPGKPIYKSTREFEHEYLGMPSAYNGFTSEQMIADFWGNFHIVGVVVGLFLVGTALRVLFLYLAPSKYNGVGVFFYAALLPELIHELEASFGSALDKIMKFTVLVVLIGLGIGIRYREARRRKTTISAQVLGERLHEFVVQ
jgi:hypothetical protein